jgi:DNA adenine methylase
MGFTNMSIYQSNIKYLPPFLKWAGGKRWLIPQIHNYLPEKFNRYYEPFVGSGAVFFSIRPRKAIISDINESLVETYQAIKKDWRTVKRILGKHHKNHCKEYYYCVRSKIFSNQYSKAAQFIYLNRTCWNGLYRVNLHGIFNVPIGTKTKVILPTDDFKQISLLLENTKIVNSDFEEIINDADEGDFIFIDPPYTVKHNKNSFIKYNEKLFSWDDQIRLRNCIFEATARGVKILMMNACHGSIKELYLNHNIEYVSLCRQSLLSGKANHRGNCEELMIKNW